MMCKIVGSMIALFNIPLTWMHILFTKSCALLTCPKGTICTEITVGGKQQFVCAPLVSATKLFPRECIISPDFSFISDDPTQVTWLRQNCRPNQCQEGVCVEAFQPLGTVFSACLPEDVIDTSMCKVCAMVMPDCAGVRCLQGMCKITKQTCNFCPYATCVSYDDGNDAPICPVTPVSCGLVECGKDMKCVITHPDDPNRCPEAVCAPNSYVEGCINCGQSGISPADCDEKEVAVALENGNVICIPLDEAQDVSGSCVACIEPPGFPTPQCQPSCSKGKSCVYSKQTCNFCMQSVCVDEAMKNEQVCPLQSPTCDMVTCQKNQQCVIAKKLIGSDCESAICILTSLITENA